jgi:hypothetical protein
MVETLLLRKFAEEDVVVSYVENLEKFVGAETKVVAIHGKYKREFYGGNSDHYKWSLGVPLYYKMLSKRLFGQGIKYPLWRFVGWPDRFMRKHLYLDFTGRGRTTDLMKAPVDEITPGFIEVGAFSEHTDIGAAAAAG